MIVIGADEAIRRQARALFKTSGSMCAAVDNEIYSLHHYEGQMGRDGADTRADAIRRVAARFDTSYDDRTRPSHSQVVAYLHGRTIPGATDF